MLNTRLQIRLNRTVKEIVSVTSPEITTPEEALQFFEELYSLIFESRTLALREETGKGVGDGH